LVASRSEHRPKITLVARKIVIAEVAVLAVAVAVRGAGKAVGRVMVVVPVAADR